MDLTVNAIHFEATDKLKAFIAKKVEKLERRNPSVRSVEVSMRVVKPETAMNKQVTLTVVVPQHPDIVADKVADTFEEALDNALEAVNPRLEKIKNEK